jgi:hypothetical protein
VARRRERWKARQARIDPRRLVFIDEDLGQDQHDARPWPMSQRRTPRRQSALRAMANPHVPGGAALRRAHCALRHRRTDHGMSFRAYVEQVLVPVLAPGDIVVTDNLGNHRAAPFAPPSRHQSQALLPGRLLARPQSNRAGLRQNEDPPAQGRRANHRRPARLLHPDRMRKLLQKRRIRFSLRSAKSDT